MSNDTRTCEVVECSKPRKSRGLCNTHYERLRRTGSVELAVKPIVCTIEDCDKPVAARGMCLMHYKRVRRNGSPDRDEFSATCTVCGDPARAKGLCSTHYQRMRLTGSVTLRIANCDRCGIEFQPKGSAKWCDECKRDGAREYTKGWYRANRLHALEYAKKRNATEHARSLRRAWMDANRTKARLWTLNRRAAIREATVGTVSIEGIEARWEYYGGKCWLCGADGEQTDHVKPLNKGGLHVLSNLRPICKSCNSSKRDRWPLETLADLPRFEGLSLQRII